MLRGLLARLALLAATVGGLVAWAPATAHAGFSAPTNYTIPPTGTSHGIQGVAVGDFNGDSDPDIAVAHQDGDKISVLLGSTGGTFTGPTDFGLFSSANPLTIAVGDFNADSDPDIAIANEGSSTGSPPGNVSILLGASGGTFTGPTNFTAGTKPQGIAIRDFNADSDPDLAVANEGGTVSVLLGGMGGGFGAATDYPVGVTPRAVAIGDFNGDSDPDLAVVNKDSAPETVSILLGGAAGSFGAATNFQTGSTPHALAIGDFNGDSDPDIAVANETAHTASVLLGGAVGSFGPRTSYSVGNLPDAIAVGEFSGDTDPDLAVGNQVSDDVSILVGGSGGSFSAATNYPASDGPASIAVADFNADSAQDLVVSNEISHHVSILLGTVPLKYPRPTGGATFHVPLVPAFNECTSTNSVHGGPLTASGSCSNPTLRTSTVTLGTSAAGGTRVGFADITVCMPPQPPTGVCSASVAGALPDVRLRGNASDVICKAGAPPAACPGGAGSDYDPVTAAGPYTSNLSPPADSNANVPQPTCKPTPPNPPACAVGSDMTAAAVIPGSSASGQARGIRITDSYSSLPSVGDPPNCGSTTSCAATVRDQGFPVPVVCQSNGTAGLGSYCGVNTTANALVPGVVEANKQAVVQTGQIQVFDSGPNGTRGDGDDQLFAVQGIFVP